MDLCSTTKVCNHCQSSESTPKCSAEDKTGKKRDHARFTKIMATKSMYYFIKIRIHEFACTLEHKKLPHKIKCVYDISLDYFNRKYR